MDAAPALATLLRACPNLRLLTTSRELLRIEGEIAYAVPALSAQEAVDLFCVRSGIEPTGTVSELCRRLDYLPLALELAAARISVLSPEQILARLSQRLDLFRGGRDADPRQQTLRATISWSVDLLPEDEKRLLARIAVFSDGCTLEAAEEVAGAGLDTLQALVDKSLLRRRGERFFMLDTIREFASELLTKLGDADRFRDLHAEFFLAMGELAYDEQFEPRLGWMQRLNAERGNLRAALDHWREHETARFAELAAALGWHWGLLGEYAEGSRRLEDAIALAGSSKRTLARALDASAGLDAWSGRAALALERLERSASIWEELGEDRELVDTLVVQGWAHFFAGDNAAGRDVFEEALEAARLLGDPLLIRRTLVGVCQVLVAIGDADRAEPLAEELNITARDSGDDTTQGDHFLADCAMIRGDYLLARSRFRGVLEQFVDLGQVAPQTWNLLGFALAGAGIGRYEEAFRLTGVVAAKWRELGISASVPFIEAWRTELMGAARSALGDERADALYAEGQAIPWDEATALALEQA